MIKSLMVIIYLVTVNIYLKQRILNILKELDIEHFENT
jgi:hypothetical protein